MPLLKVTNLTKHYHLPSTTETVRAVDGVSFELEAGEIIGVVGESGCGKTTLGRCILRLIEPTSGTVLFKGEDVTAVSQIKLRALRRQMQIVFQDPFASLDPRWRIYEILEEPLRVHNIVPADERKKEILRLLSDVGLPTDAAYRFPHEFSGGQRQRIGIARALALRPEFLIADEPVSALDVSIRAQILNFLLALQRDKGIAIIFIGHDLGVVRQISKRVFVMHRGRIVEEAIADELFENPRHPYTRALLEAIPSIKNIGGAQKRHDDRVETIIDKSKTANGCSYRFRCELAQDICRSTTPDLAEIGSGSNHKSACHFRNELPKFNHVEQVAIA